MGDSYLYVDSAPAPELINWENLKVSIRERLIRFATTSLVSIGLLLGTCLVIFIFNNYQQIAKSYSPSIDCYQFRGTEEITIEMA